MDTKLETLIMKSFDYYDKQNTSYNNLIESSNISKQNPNSLMRSDNNTKEYTSTLITSQQILPSIKFENSTENFDYEILGLFDMKTNVWIWAWCFPFVDAKLNKESKSLLKYALNLNITDIGSKDHYFLKTQLTNSRIHMKNNFQLDILLSICSYILGNNIKFIYPDVKQLSPTHTVIYFLLIK